MGRIERMPDDTTFRMLRATRLNLAHGETRGAGSDDGRRRQPGVELSVECFLEVEPLGTVLLHQLRTLDSGLEVVGKFQTIGCAVGHRPELDQRRPCVRYKLAQAPFRA